MIKADICVIGAGSAGLSVAAGAAQMGARTVLIERNRMGGDCLNTGCVPSKSLLVCATVAHTVREAGRYGIAVGEPRIDMTAVHDYVHAAIGTIAPHDSVERFTALGCTVIEARARFLDHRTVEGGDARVEARRFVVATGSRAAVPPIPGLDETPYFTNETLFDNKVLPGHLVIVGGGPIGCEMAQAYRRLGSKVTVLARGSILPKDDPEAVDVVRRTFAAEAITLIENISIRRVERSENGIAVTIGHGGNDTRIAGSHLLVAAGRKADVEDLGLEDAGIRFSTAGIEVDGALRTSNRRAYAAGDVTGGYQFTHLAEYHAGLILRNALFRLPVATDLRAFPWVTYTDPEVAQIGMTEVQSRETYGARVRVLRVPFAENDRAQTEKATRGFVKASVTKQGRVVGATIIGRHAGELALPWALAISQRVRISALASMIAPYPTLSEIAKRAAGNFYGPMLFSGRGRALVRLLGWLG